MDLITAIKNLEELIQDISDDNLVEEVSEIKEKIESDKFYIVVLGLFKRGKSSFINALIGAEILPSAITPLTAIITFIEYGDKNTAEIIFKDKRKSTIPVLEVRKYISEKENPKNKKNVLYVRIIIKAEILKKATFIDTPGIGSTLEHNTDTTYSFVNKIDAALFLLSADIPITPAEIKFLQVLRKRVKSIIFLFNKIDLVNSIELQEVLDFNKSAINGIIENDNIEIIPFSSRKAMEAKISNNEKLLKYSNINRIETELFKLIEFNKKEVLELSNIRRFVILIDDVISFLDLRIKSLNLPINELEEKLALFKKSYENMKREKEDFDILMLGKIDKLQRFVNDQILEFKARLLNLFNTEIFIKSKESIKTIKKDGIFKFQNKIYPSLINEFNKLRENLEVDVKLQFYDILSGYRKKSASFLNELFENSNVKTDFSFESLMNSFDLNVYTDFYYKFDYDFTVVGLKNSILYKFMPDILIEMFIYPQIIKNIHLKIDANCGGVTYDINYKIQESFRKFKFDLEKKNELKLSRIRKIIEDTIYEKQNNEINLNSEIAMIKEKMDKLLVMKKKYSFIFHEE